MNQIIAKSDYKYAYSSIREEFRLTGFTGAFKEYQRLTNQYCNIPGPLGVLSRHAIRCAFESFCCRGNNF